MSQHSDAALARLQVVAHELLEAREDSGYRVGQALTLDPSFTETRHVLSALTRAFVIHHLRRGAQMAHIDCRTTPGSGLDLCDFDGSIYRRYRLKSYSGSMDAPVFTEKDDTTLFEPEEGMLFREERWVIGYRIDGNDEFADLLAAEALGVEPGNPGSLILGQVVALDGILVPDPSQGFQSDDEDDLPGYEDTEADEDPGEIG